MKASFVVLSLPAILSACDRANRARLSQPGFIHLGNADATELAAIAARIIPSDDTPGATEAGVIYFIDQVLDENRVQERNQLSDGIRDLNRQVSEDYGVNLFSELDPDQQDRVLASIEQTAFFGTMRFLTVAGMFALAGYGGNGPDIGYQLIGFENRHAWTAPYGFYDADYNERGQ